MKSRKKLWNREKQFRIKINISESRKKIQNREKYFRIEKYFVTRIEKKSLKKSLHKMWLSNWK